MATPRLVLLCAPFCFAMLSLGCSSEDPTGPLEPQADYSYSLTTTLAPASEAEHCKFVKAPAEQIFINRDEVRYTAGSHHFLFYETPYDTIPTEDNEGNPIQYLDEETGVFDCSEGVTLSYSVTRLVGGSQNADGDSMVDLPPGVGVPVEADAVLLMNAHYINTTGEELNPRVDIDLYTVPPAELEQEAGILFWYNPFITAPAMSSSFVTATCDIPDDITITNMQSHMHARGVDYEAVMIAPDATRSSMYTNTDWENVAVERFEPGMAVTSGSRIEYTCHYNNPGTEDIYQGPRSTDEMCMLIGSYYPAKPHVSLCSGDPEFPSETNWFGAEWLGQGTATCAESLNCMQEALNASGADPFAASRMVGECVLAADPAVSPEFSDVVGCTISSFLAGKNPFDECVAAYTACSAK